MKQLKEAQQHILLLLKMPSLNFPAFDFFALLLLPSNYEVKIINVKLMKL